MVTIKRKYAPKTITSVD